MPNQPEEEAPPNSNGEVVAQYANFAEPSVPQPACRSSHRNRRRITCEVRDGLPTVLGKTQGYYVSRLGGARMLVLNRRPGERLRINGTIEIVILEIQPDQVKIAIETSPGDVKDLLG